MTGYGRGETVVRGLKVEVELSSVNRRQFDVRLNLPREISTLESRIHELIHQSVSRGCVTGAVRLTSVGTGKGGVRVDLAAARAYVRSLREAARELKLKDDLALSALLTHPEVLVRDRSLQSAEDLWPAVRTALKAALRELVDMRVKEGEAIEADLVERFAKLKHECRQVEKLAPGVAERYRKKLKKRMKQIGVDMAATDAQLVREVALYADRSDVSEEITRLCSHFGQVEANVRSGKRTGRALDFLCQEMFREINTIGSKAGSASISRHVVRFKALLETAREQVQNVE